MSVSEAQLKQIKSKVCRNGHPRTCEGTSLNHRGGPGKLHPVCLECKNNAQANRYDEERAARRERQHLEQIARDQKLAAYHASDEYKLMRKQQAFEIARITSLKNARNEIVRRMMIEIMPYARALREITNASNAFEKACEANYDRMRISLDEAREMEYARYPISIQNNSHDDVVSLQDGYLFTQRNWIELPRVVITDGDLDDKDEVDQEIIDLLVETCRAARVHKLQEDLIDVGYIDYLQRALVVLGFQDHASQLEEEPPDASGNR